MKNEELTTSQRLKMLREIKGLSQEQLAQSVNVSAKTVSAWETGEREITLPNVKVVAKEFNVPEPFILYGLEVDKVDSHLFHQIKEYLTKMDNLRIVDKLYNKCKTLIENDNIEFDEEFLPEYDSKTNSITSGGLFVFDKLPLVKERIDYQNCYRIDESKIDDDSCYQYDISSLAYFGLDEIITEQFSSDLELTNLVDSDSLELFNLALSNVLNNKHKKSPSYFGREYNYEYDEEYKQDQLNKTLENLSPSLKNFWELIILLIDNGAVYLKQVGSGDDVTYFTEEVDVVRTNVIYRLALEHTGRI